MIRADESDGDVPASRVDLKVVPGARRDEICGRLGERLKVRVAAAPEDGKANAAVCSLLASALGIKARQVQVVAGMASAEKTVRIAGLTAEAVRLALASYGT